MDPILPIPNAANLTASGMAPLPINASLGAPGIFVSTQDVDDLLSSYDSDTRDYILKHTSEDRTNADIIECLNKLHGKG